MKTHRFDDTIKRHVGRGQSQGEEQLLLQLPLFLKSQVQAQHLLQVWVTYLNFFQVLAIAVTGDGGAGETKLRGLGMV